MLMIQVGVIGASDCDDEIYEVAYRLGQLLAENKCILINGGLGGVMEASAKGAKSKGGIVVGILPFAEKKYSNPYIDIIIATNMGHARDVIIVHSSDAIIAVDGDYGTLSEIAIALKEGKKVVAINPKFDVPGLLTADNEADAVKKVLEVDR
ncbi:MAG TPA: TIGR00725 family protein [Archaeoglobaceae archaeon]|nr:TIGR00725 family protein [Archaeoglobaceae archaeon]